MRVTESPLTPEQLIDRVRDAVDGVDVVGPPGTAALAMFRAAMTLAAIALRRLGEAERELQLTEMENLTRDTLLRMAVRAAQRRRMIN